MSRDCAPRTMSTASPRRTRPIPTTPATMIALILIIICVGFPGLTCADTVPSTSPTPATKAPSRTACSVNEDCHSARVCILNACRALPPNNQLAYKMPSPSPVNQDLGYGMSVTVLILLGSFLFAHSKMKERAFRRAILGEVQAPPNGEYTSASSGAESGRGSLSKALSSRRLGSSRGNLLGDVVHGSQNPLFYDELGEVYTAPDRMTRSASMMSDATSVYDYRGVSRASFESEFDRHSIVLVKAGDDADGLPHQIIERPTIESSQESGALELLDASNAGGSEPNNRDSRSNSNSNSSSSSSSQDDQVTRHPLTEGLDDEQETGPAREGSMERLILSVAGATTHRASSTETADDTTTTTISTTTTTRRTSERSSGTSTRPAKRPSGTTSKDKVTSVADKLSPPSKIPSNIPAPRKPAAQVTHRYRGAGYGASSTKWGSAMTIVVEQDGNYSSSDDEGDDDLRAAGQGQSTTTSEVDPNSDKDSFADFEGRRSRVSFGSFISANSLASGARRVRDSFGSLSSAISDAVRKRTPSRSSFGSFGSFSSAPGGMSSASGRQRMGTNAMSFDSLSSAGDLGDLHHRRSTSGGSGLNMGHRRSTSAGPGMDDSVWGSMSTMNNLSFVEEEIADDLESSNSTRTLSSSTTTAPK